MNDLRRIESLGASKLLVLPLFWLWKMAKSLGGMTTRTAGWVARRWEWVKRVA
jgi:hypothetical protein